MVKQSYCNREHMTLASSLTPETMDHIQDPEYFLEIKKYGEKMHFI